MNISVDRVESNEGSGLDDRPSYVSEALEADRVVGWKEGKPLVPHPGGLDDGLQLGDSPEEAYSHYYTQDDLLLPQAGPFLQKLLNRVDSVSEAAEEVSTDVQTVEKAMSLHDVEPPTEAEGGETGADESDDGLVLPSGESVPFAWSHPLVLAQLLSDGLSVPEISRYLTREVGERIRATDVRDAARDAGLLGEESADDPPLHAPASRTQTAGDREYSKTPW